MKSEQRDMCEKACFIVPPKIACVAGPAGTFFLGPPGGAEGGAKFEKKKLFVMILQ